MKYIYSIGTAFMMATVVGCASNGKVAIVDPVGPSPTDRAKNSSEGVLQVYSANEKALGHIWASDVIDKDDQKYEWSHTDYSIYNLNGGLVKEVRNSKNKYDDFPALVNLPPGEYKVEAQAPDGDGWTTTYDVMVLIKPGLKTVVHLEPNWSPKKEPQRDKTLVTGPDGRILGWQASQ
jgi:hypothetical protein